MCIADVLRTMPSKAIELASFDLFKKVLIPGDPSNGIGGFLVSVAGAMAGEVNNLHPICAVGTYSLQQPFNHKPQIYVLDRMEVGFGIS